VALVYDWHVRWALDYAWTAHRFHQKYEETVQSHHAALQRAGYGVDIIDQTSDLSPYKAVIAPMVFLLREGFAERLTAFAREGGLVYLTYMSGYVDEEDLRFVTTPPLEALTGVRTDELDAWDKGHENCFLWQGREWPIHEVAQLCTLKGAEALAVYENQFYKGLPVLTRNPVGKGLCFTLQARVETGCLTAVLGGLLQEHGVEPLVKELPAGVTASARYGADGTEYLFLQNANREAAVCALPDSWVRLDRTGTAGGEIRLDAFSIAVLKRG
jgi:beta-galactosidase